MGQPLRLRPDYDAAKLRALARCSNDAAQLRRLLALAAIYDGASRSKAARLGSVTLQIVRDWVMRFEYDRTVVLAARDGVEMGARLTEVLRQERQRNLAEVLACADADGSKTNRNSE
jgi:transposase